MTVYVHVLIGHDFQIVRNNVRQCQCAVLGNVTGVLCIYCKQYILTGNQVVAVLRVTCTCCRTSQTCCLGQIDLCRCRSRRCRRCRNGNRCTALRQIRPFVRTNAAYTYCQFVVDSAACERVSNNKLICLQRQRCCIRCHLCLGIAAVLNPLYCNGRSRGTYKCNLNITRKCQVILEILCCRCTIKGQSCRQ